MCYCQTLKLIGSCPVCGEPQSRTASPLPGFSQAKEWVLAYRNHIHLKELNAAAAVLFREARMSDAMEWISLLDEVSTKRKYLLESEIKMRRELCIKAMGVIGFNPGKEDGPVNQVVPTTFEQFNAKASA